jgi:hypothetical protein
MTPEPKPQERCFFVSYSGPDIHKREESMRIVWTGAGSQEALAKFLRRKARRHV